MQHRAAPDDRLLLLDEEAHGDAAHAVGLRRHEHLVDHDRGVLDAEHPRDREAPHVGVDDGDLVAPLGEGDGEVGGERRLAHAALARGDEQHAGGARRVGEGDDPALGVAVALVGAGGAGRVAVEHLAHRGALLVGHHGEVEVDAVDAVEGDDRGADPVLDLVAERAAGDGEGDADGGHSPVDGHALDHAEVDDAAVQLGVLDGAERLDDVGFGGGHGDGAFRGAGARFER